MRIFANEGLYKRNTRLAFAANLAGMFFLVASIFVLFNSDQFFGLYLLFLLLGIVLVQVGTYFGRWNRRPDLAFNQALSSLDDNYSLYHFRTAVSHLLLGPTGLWILIPRHTRGAITYDSRRKRWRAKSRGILSRFGQEAIGRPILDASMEAEALDRYLQKHWTEGGLRVQAALVFMDEAAEVQAGDAPIPTASIKKLKQVLLKADEKNLLTQNQIKQLNDLFAKQ